MTPYEALVVLLAIVIGTYTTNTIIDFAVDIVDDLNYRILCSTTSEKQTVSRKSMLLNIFQYISHRYAISSQLQGSATSSRGYLTSLPQRLLMPAPMPIPRPSSMETITTTTIKTTTKSQKGINIKDASPDSPFSHLHAMLAELAETYSEHIYMVPNNVITTITTTVNTCSGSCVTSIYARTRRSKQTAYHGEIAHVHADGSLRLILHLSDALLAVNKGWCKPAVSFPHSSACARHYSWIRAPRRIEDFGTIRELVKAGMWYARGYGPANRIGEEEEALLEYPCK
jgi:hypothetical protein